MGDSFNALSAATGSPEDKLKDAASRLLDQTDPLRKKLIGQSKAFLNGGMDVMSTPEFLAMKQFAGLQADQAKDNILETMPNGGVLLDKLADVDIGKARGLSEAAGSIYGNQLNRATALATGAPLNAAMGGLGALTQLDAAREQADADREAGAKGGIGAALGGFLGGK